MKSYNFTVIGAPVGTYEYEYLAESLEDAKRYGMPVVRKNCLRPSGLAS